MRKIGQIIIPDGIKPYPESHEIVVADALACVGHIIEFNCPNLGYKIKSVDIYVDGVLWEIKNPTNSTKSTIENQFRKASKQASRLIIGLVRTNLTEQQALTDTKKQLKMHHRIKEVKLVTRAGKVIDIK